MPGIHKALLAPQKQVYGSKLVETGGSEAFKDRLNYIRYERGRGEGGRRRELLHLYVVLLYCYPKPCGF